MHFRIKKHFEKQPQLHSQTDLIIRLENLFQKLVFIGFQSLKSNILPFQTHNNLEKNISF
jgi:hypothetical protein